jgi:hypothetical protein
MSQRLTRALIGTVALVLAAHSVMAQTKPAAGPSPAATKGTVYDVEFVFDNETYTGKMTLNIVKGAVSGSMSIDSPTTVTGEVAGTLKDTKLALDYPYSMTGERPCTGRVVVDATMKDGAAQGTARSSGCGDPVDGTFTLKRSAAK